MLPDQLIYQNPYFLIQKHSQWPTQLFDYVRELREEKIIKLKIKNSDTNWLDLQSTNNVKSLIVTASDEICPKNKINPRNSIIIWQRVLAYCMRLKTGATKADNGNGISLTTIKLKKALKKISKQEECFPKQIPRIQNADKHHYHH